LNETCYLKIDGRIVYLWRAVDAEGEVLDLLVQTRRNKQAALKLMRKLLKKYGFVPDKLVTDDLRSLPPTMIFGPDKMSQKGQSNGDHHPQNRRRGNAGLQ
jgi:transposase-like protein